MPATLTISSLSSSTRRSPPSAHDAEQSPAVECNVPGCALNSVDLLQGQKTVAITHNGFIYRLQATRLGKLILTK